jgi:hypothetical protein
MEVSLAERWSEGSEGNELVGVGSAGVGSAGHHVPEEDAP